MRSWRRRKSRPQWHLKFRDIGLGGWMVLQAGLHARRSSARLYQSLMWRSSRSITMLSRQRLRGPWRGRVFWSSPNNTHFGILSSDMRPTCPNQRRRRVLSISTTDRARTHTHTHTHTHTTHTHTHTHTHTGSRKSYQGRTCFHDDTWTQALTSC